MRDILPADMQRRHHVIDTITEVFETFGFEPIQTPVMELNEILMGKYGEDAEKLIYHAKHPGSDDELSLRYDLTVPLTRFFAMHENELALPFKRYHIAPVWRAENPQRGRYREFYQCDADIVGIPGAVADAEVIALTVTGIQGLGFADFVTKINSRKLLTAIGEFAGVEGEQLSNLYRTIDKADKIGLNGVRKEFLQNGMPEATVNKMLNLIAAAQGQAGVAAGRRTLGFLREEMGELETAAQALNELDALLDNLEMFGTLDPNIGLDFTMVRGLSYYTGAIFETGLTSADPEERVGSVSGGGRYDDLIGMFRKESLPTVGTSFGIERLIVLMDKRGLYPSTLGKTVVQVLVSVFSADTRAASVGVATALRNAGIRTELYMQDKALGKQFTYADKKGIPLVAIIGPDEQAAGKVKFKRLADATETTVSVENAGQAARDLLAR
jgi:histidyl-tRNA synthetase